MHEACAALWFLGLFAMQKVGSGGHYAVSRTAPTEHEAPSRRPVRWQSARRRQQQHSRNTKLNSTPPPADALGERTFFIILLTTTTAGITPFRSAAEKTTLQLNRPSVNNLVSTDQIFRPFRAAEEKNREEKGKKVRPSKRWGRIEAAMANRGANTARPTA